MRIILLVLFALSLCAEEPKAFSAEESAKVLAEIKAKKLAKAASEAEKQPREFNPADAKRDDQMRKFKDMKEEEAAKAKRAKLTRDAESYMQKAIAAAKNAVAQAEQFKIREEAEGNSSGRSVYRNKVVLKDSGRTNKAVLDAVDQVKDFLEKCDSARAAAGMEPMKRNTLDSWIMEKGR